MQFPNETEAGYTISYPTIETFRHDDVPPDVFQVDLPAADSDELYQRLSADDLAQFDAYPAMNLGPTFRDYTLNTVTRYQPRRLPDGTSKPDNVFSIYVKWNAEGRVEGRIDVTSHGPLADAARAWIIPAGEDVSVNRGAARLSEDGRKLVIDGADSFISITARDRGQTLAAGATLQPAAPASQPVPPAAVRAGS
jgi:hypothetical protein